MNRNHPTTTTPAWQRLVATLAVLIMAVGFGCVSDEPKSLVSEPGKAPYYTDLAEAKLAAAEGQMLAVDFWADW